MKDVLLRGTVKSSRARRRKRIWKNTVMAMAAVVVFCTVYALVLPAITMSDEPICAVQAHEHADSCYRTEGVLAVCPAADGSAVLHSHNESCYNGGVLWCPLPEQSEHLHTEACMQQAQVLTCLIDEVAPHTHGDECYTDVSTLGCGMEECQPHAHEDGCYAEENTLSCQQEESDTHAHSEECYTTEQKLVCQTPENPGHTHDEACYTAGRELTCQLAETLGHSHDETCYELRDQIICGLEQVAVHTHGDACLNEQGSVICGITPAAVHEHGENCSTIVKLAEPELICQLPEHIHSAACFPEQQPSEQSIFLCGIGTHTHGDGCRDENGKTLCSLTEHTHSEVCVVEDYDPNADLETPEIWTASFADVTLTGNWPQDILAIAESQLGYRESAKNVKLWEDNSVKGYTRYGAWYGVPHGDWCAMFVSFCVNYAGADEVPQDSVCNTYIEKLQAAQLYREAANYLPKPGDIIFFDWERTGGEVTDVDHAGLVAQIILDEAGTPIQIKTIEGNWEDRVLYRTYAIDDPAIIGYGDVPMGPAKTCVCSLDAHLHTEDCEDGEGNVICGIEEHLHDESCYGHSLFYRDDTLQAQLIIQNVDELPEDLTMTVTVVTEELDPNLYGSMSAALELRMEESPYFVGDAGFYQVELQSGGAEYTLPEGAKVVMDVTFTQPVFDSQAVADGRGLYTYLLEPGEPITLFSGQTIDTFETQDTTGESYLNAADGLTGLRLELNDQRAFAVALASTTQTGTFWTRVTSASELTAGNTYMIVSAEGNYALRGNSNGNNTAVVLETVKGNTDYYTIRARSGSIDNTLYWTITPSGSKFTVRNQGTSNYLYMARRILSVTLISSSSANLSFSYLTPEYCWRISNGSNYLFNEGGSFQAGTGGNSTYYGTKYYARDMLIFKLSDVTELEVPDDVVSATGGSENGEGPDKPDYDPFIEPSDEKTGDTSVVNPENPALSVSGKYYSDKATSDLETKFDLDNYALNSENDGMIRTDKSVIYMDDDYDAFETYPANTFGITLSALGQEYEMPHEDVVRTPIDVVFVLDVSGSMASNGNSQGEEDGNDASRAWNMVAATNKAIKKIMEDHPANRVGIVLYATGAWQLLPLDRYIADNNEYLHINVINVTMQNNPDRSKPIHFVETTASLKNDAGKSYANIGTGFNQGYGTYTQAGIALGGKTFEEIGDDTTYTTTFGEGEEAREYTVNRQPVIILLSDGEPTHATNIYMDPLSGPHYGDGLGDLTNARGIMGYNVILTANYFKRMVGIQYNQPALFFTVGMSINDTADKPLVEGSKTGDTYKRAVLNPTPELIDSLNDSMLGGDVTATQLKNLIQSKFTGSTVTVTPNWPDDWTGDPHAVISVLQGNPYADDYSYSDGAYFGELSDTDLEAIFTKIVEDSLKATPYGFILHKSSSIELTDRIGKGMEIKGVPVLRYAGVNYNPVEAKTENGVTTYIYRGTYTHPYLPEKVYHLEDIKVTVYYNENGHQVVSMYIPDTALPAYTPELIGKQFYYEALPVRLIYQVGLTAESEQQVLDLYKTGGTATFYTNVWDEGGEQSISNLYPSKDNPFYYEIVASTGTTRYHAHHDLKDDGTNVTDTLEYIVDCSKVTDSIDGESITKVVHKLGNNGKLVFEVPGVDIPAQKVWSSGAEPDEATELELMIYNVQTSETGVEEATYIKSIFLTAENDWKGTFEDMPQLPSGYYAIAEKIPTGYHAQYSGETVTLVIDDKSVLAAKVDTSDPDAIAVTVVTNVLEVRLPNTGGTGTEIYYTFGVLLLAAALMYIAMNGRLRRREGR